MYNESRHWIEIISAKKKEMICLNSILHKHNTNIIDFLLLSCWPKPIQVGAKPGQ